MKEKMKQSFFKSLRFRIMVLLVIIGILPCLIIEKVIVNSYENRAVEWKKMNVKNQCDILGNQLMKEVIWSISSPKLLMENYLFCLPYIMGGF